MILDNGIVTPPILGGWGSHRPDLRQMILAVLIDGDGRPVCSEMWPGNTADVTTLVHPYLNMVHNP
jgi:transposase